MWSSEPPSHLSALTSPRRLDFPFASPPGSLLQSFNEAPRIHTELIWDYLPLLSPSASLLRRLSGTDWQGTLFLIRQMAWGETLIWTSSASKRTALPGWAQRPGTANYTTLMLLPCQLIHSIKACVFVCVWKSERYCRDVASCKPSTPLLFGSDLFSHEYQ